MSAAGVFWLQLQTQGTSSEMDPKLSGIYTQQTTVLPSPLLQTTFSTSTLIPRCVGTDFLLKRSDILFFKCPDKDMQNIYTVDTINDRLFRRMYVVPLAYSVVIGRGWSGGDTSIEVVDRNCCPHHNFKIVVLCMNVR